MSDFRVVIYLPFPPSSRKYYIKGRILSKAALEYRHMVAECVQEQRAETNIDEKVCFTPILFPPDRRKRDLDNHMKSLQDALTQADVWTDDSLVDQLRVYRGEVIKHGSCIVIITPATKLIKFTTNSCDLDLT